MTVNELLSHVRLHYGPILVRAASDRQNRNPWVRVDGRALRTYLLGFSQHDPAPWTPRYDGGRLFLDGA